MACAGAVSDLGDLGAEALGGRFQELDADELAEDVADVPVGLLVDFEAVEDGLYFFLISGAKSTTGSPSLELDWEQPMMCACRLLRLWEIGRLKLERG